MRIPRATSRAAAIGVLIAVASSASAAIASGSAPERAAAGTGGRITLEVESATPGALAAAAAVTLSAGGQVIGSAPDVLLVNLPARAVQRLTEVVDGEVRQPIPVDIRPEPVGERALLEAFGPSASTQVATTNATAWHEAGVDGTGVRIGVIDFFDTKYWITDEHGPLPVAGVTARCLDAGDDCTDEFFDGVDLGGEEHGVAVVELLRDMAPGVEIYLGQATTSSDYRAIVSWFASNGVQIVNRSLGSRYDGPGDGRGTLDEIVTEAVDSGMLWVNSGGNSGDRRYYREPVRLSGDRVAFGPTGATTYLPFTNCIALGGVRWANDWDVPSAQRTDYDVYLWEAPTGNLDAKALVDSSTRDQRRGATPVELLPQSRCPGLGNSLYLEVRLRAGDPTGDVLEILDYGNGITQFTRAAYSAAVSVVDSRDRGVLGVGAIDPPEQGVVAPYSSQGPTNDGRIVPALVAPAGGYSAVYRGNFNGSSASAPVVAGAAALLLDAELAAGPRPLGDLIRSLAIDRGQPGPDNVYGSGEFRLPAPPIGSGVDTPSRFVGLGAPTRFLDTRPASAVGPAGSAGVVEAGDVLTLPIAGVLGVPPTGVTAVVANLALVAPDRPGYLQALPTGEAAIGGFANVNVDSSLRTRSNLAIVPLAADGTISLYSVPRGHVVVDVLGWFEAAPVATTSGRFVALPLAQRVLDTRSAGSAGPLRSGELREVPLPASIDPQQIGSLVVTVIATGSTGVGWVQAVPIDRPDAVGRTATVNVTVPGSVANTAIVPTTSDGIAITGQFANGGTSHVIVDVVGYITSGGSPASTDGRYVPITPARAFDSRPIGAGILDSEIVLVDATSAPAVDVPASARAVMWSVTMIRAAHSGYLRGWGADDPEPSISSLNWSVTGETRAGSAITGVDGGRARFRVEDGIVGAPGRIGDLTVDAFGYFT